MERKIYDCFQFFNELDILEIRLNELDSQVDYFVIVEAELSHQLKPKPLFFKENKERYSKFLHKIIHLVVPADKFVSNDIESFGHHNDTIQRDYLRNGIVNADDEDFIMISDLDEIISSKRIKEFRNTQYWKDGIPVIFEQYLYLWYLNARANGYLWHNAGMCLKKNLETFGTRGFKDNKTCLTFPRIRHGGWHFSYVGNANTVKTKLDNFAHTEFSHLTVDDLKKNRETLIDPLGRKDEGINIIVDPIETMPVYVQQNIEKFKDFIR
jgi:beta-1,4-mannosyl-glycoprotein beta-1,4-N-acetylglucosaminyltransferase